MINVCEKCGEYHPDKKVDVDASVAICPNCGFRSSFLRMPLFVLSGASGTGKTTIARELMKQMDSVIILDSDIMWSDAWAQSLGDYFEQWLRLCKNVGQAGRPVVLVGAGIGVPDNLEHCVERRYFSNIYYLALICSSGELEARLKARPQWRKSGSDAYVEEHRKFNEWFINYDSTQGKPCIDTIETDGPDLDQKVDLVRAWIEQRLG